MAYWSVRNEESGYKNGYTYVEESVRRMRANLGDPEAPVHPIGGIGDVITEGELRDYLRALTDTDSLGGSIYDYRTMNGGHWGVLRGTEAALAAPPPRRPPCPPAHHPVAPPTTRARARRRRGDDRAVRRHDTAAGGDGGPSGRHDAPSSTPAVTRHSLGALRRLRSWWRGARRAPVTRTECPTRIENR